MKSIAFILIVGLISVGNTCELDTKMEKAGLRNIHDELPKIEIDLVYATKNNMFGKIMFGCMKKAYLQPKAIDKLKLAQTILSEKRPGFYFKILDAARPRNIQKKMWLKVKGTPLQPYVADPSRGSMHNYGAAVDITIVDSNGVELDMGDPTPRFKIVGKSQKEINRFLANLEITQLQTDNRELLKSVMLKAGFEGLSHEWWHFRAFPKKYVRKHFKIIE